jgi:hypothetical protein
MKKEWIIVGVVVVILYLIYTKNTQAQTAAQLQSQQLAAQPNLGNILSSIAGSLGKSKSGAGGSLGGGSGGGGMQGTSNAAQSSTNNSDPYGSMDPNSPYYEGSSGSDSGNDDTSQSEDGGY